MTASESDRNEEGTRKIREERRDGKVDRESRSLARECAEAAKASFPAETEVLSPLIKAAPLFSSFLFQFDGGKGQSN